MFKNTLTHKLRSLCYFKYGRVNQALTEKKEQLVGLIVQTKFIHGLRNPWSKSVLKRASPGLVLIIT